MGRRALRKIDSALDLSQWLLSYDDPKAVWNQRELFARSAPLEIDVGSGKGLFLLSAARRRPDVNFLGIEVSGRYARHTAGRLARAEIENARVLHGDAIRMFRENLSAESVAAVHVYFPDPWWKARHRKRRVMNEVFATHVQRVLAPGGRLHFWTDVDEYFHSTVELLAAVTTLGGPLAVEEPDAEHDLDYRTHFERRMRLSGMPVFRAEFYKPTGDA